VRWRPEETDMLIVARTDALAAIFWWEQWLARAL
jgi:hypothetical protein